MSIEIYGGKIVKLVKERCQPHSQFFQNKSVTIVLFNPPNNLQGQQLLQQYKAAVTSTNQKEKTFKFLGCNVNRVELAANVEYEQFKNILCEAAKDPQSIGIIIQNPIPNKDLKKEFKTIPDRLDIDGIKKTSVFDAPATSEAMVRLVKGFATKTDKIAVVGSLGFVGKGITKLLERDGYQIIKLDRIKGNNLAKIAEGVQKADIVVSCTGSPNLIKPEYLNANHKLVVDGGFVPQEDGTIDGDVSKDAYDIPQAIAPVPGGVGPTQMAVLLERIMKVAGIEIQPWDYKKDILNRSQSTQTDRAINPQLIKIQQNLAQLKQQEPSIIRIAELVTQKLNKRQLKSIKEAGYIVDWKDEEKRLIIYEKDRLVVTVRLTKEGWKPAFVGTNKSGLTKKDIGFFDDVKQQQNEKVKKPERIPKKDIEIGD